MHQIQDLRKQLKAKGGYFSVVKNTLFKIAAGDAAASMPEAMTSGPTAIAFIYENEAECAKVLSDFTKTNKSLVIKGGYISGSFFDDKQVEALAKLPPKDVLIAQVIGTIVAPLTNLVGTIEALYAKPIRTIYAAADKVSEGAPAPAAPAPAEPVATAPTEESVTAEQDSTEQASEEAPTPAEAPAEEATEGEAGA